MVVGVTYIRICIISAQRVLAQFKLVQYDTDQYAQCATARIDLDPSQRQHCSRRPAPGDVSEHTSKYTRL